MPQLRPDCVLLGLLCCAPAIVGGPIHFVCLAGEHILAHECRPLLVRAVGASRVGDEVCTYHLSLQCGRGLRLLLPVLQRISGFALVARYGLRRVLACGLLDSLLLRFEHLRVVLVHSIKFVEIVIDLLYCDEATVVFVDHAENRLVLLLVNREFLLHFVRLGV